MIECYIDCCLFTAFKLSFGPGKAVFFEKTLTGSIFVEHFFYCKFFSFFLVLAGIFFWTRNNSHGFKFGGSTFFGGCEE